MKLRTIEKDQKSAKFTFLASISPSWLFHLFSVLANIYGKKNITMTLGQKIKKLRADRGLRQIDLAEEMAVNPQTVSKWELDINEPDLETIRHMAKFLGCSVVYLVEEDEDEPEEAITTTAVPQ